MGGCCSSAPVVDGGVPGETPEQFSPINPTAKQREKGKTMGRRSTFKYLGGSTGYTCRPGVDKSDQDIEFIAGVLRGNPNINLLCKLSDEHIKQLVEVAWKEEYIPGQTMQSEGDLSNEVFFMVQDGSFEVASHTPFEVVQQSGVSYVCRPRDQGEEEAALSPAENRRTVRTVGRGLCVGDRSMAFNQPRLVTVQAQTEATVWNISQSDFKIIQNVALKERKLSGNESAGKSPVEEQLIASALSFNANLQRLVPLNKELIREVVAIAQRREVAKGHVLVHEGDFNAEAFYIVTEGSFEASSAEPFNVVKGGEVAYVHRAAHTGGYVSEAAQPRTTALYGRGLCFGEISMLHCAPCFATVKALERSVIWVVDRSNFQLIQMKGAEEQMKNRVRYLEGLEAAKSLPPGGRDAVAGLMETMRFNQGEVMLHQGTSYSALYILYEGAVAVEVDGKEQSRLEAVPSEGTHHRFAETALKKDCPHPSTIRVTSPHATVLSLEREDFSSVWDQVIEGVSAPAFERLYTRKLPRRGSDLKESDFETLGLLGCGAFGPVELVKRPAKDAIYARKSMSKGLVARKGMVASAAQEKAVWEMLASPFVVKLVDSYSTSQHFNLILEAALGGELGALYERQGLSGSVEHARYYVAGMALALDCLHRLKVVYRNLKPQNVLIGSNGRPKLTDMGLAKVVIGQTFTMCGAPNYMAPEVLAGTGHGRAVDWWSLGVLAFELMAGYAPFESDHPMRVYMNVMRGIARVGMPPACKGPFSDFVTSMLAQQAVERLPVRQGGIGNIKEHRWFVGFDWQSMQAATLEPPYAPELAGPTDVSNFSPRQDDLPQPVEYDNEEGLWEEEFESPEPARESHVSVGSARGPRD